MDKVTYSSLKIEKKSKKKNGNSYYSYYLHFLVYTIFITFILYLPPSIIVYLNGMVFQKKKYLLALKILKNLLSDSTFWLALKNNVYLILVSVFVQIPLGLIMALVLLSKIRGKKILNVIYFLPFLMSAVAIGLLWTLMYDPVNGPINKFLEFFGIDSIHWLASNKTAIVAVLVVIVWQFAPFYMILFKAAMVGIPEELYEAADIDGAK